jgi:hypothetical protein
MLLLFIGGLMESRELRQYVDILSITLAVFTLDILLYGYFLQTNTNYINTFIFVDVVIVLLSSIIGRKVAQKLELPVWWASYAEVESRRSIFISALIGIVIVGLNTFILCNYNIDRIPWLRFTDIYQSLFLALRAALTEEVIFRLLIFSVTVKLSSKLIKSNSICFIIGVSASAITFAMLHNGVYLSFIFGIGLWYIYRNTGLIPAMVIHFLADFIPFSLIYTK